LRYQLTQGFVIGAVLIPAGETIDLDPNKSEAQLSDFSKLARGHIPPAEAIALDDEARELIAWAHPSRQHPSRTPLPAELSGLEFKLDGNRVVGWRRKTTT
jgi:hypothetical protein